MFRAPVIGVALAVLVTCVALRTNYGVGGGADSFGYVSQADLWLAGDLIVEQDWLRGAPWPHVQLSTAPLGYRPAQTGPAIVPMYAPGLPLLLAPGKPCRTSAASSRLLPDGRPSGGHNVSDGRRIGSPDVGAAAAWLIATCPVVLFMMASPMSDVPAGGDDGHGDAPVVCIPLEKAVHSSRDYRWLSLILIRPNLAPSVVLIGFWLLVLDRQTPAWRVRIERSARSWARRRARRHRHGD